MFRHFLPAGRPKPGMLLTGAVVPIFAGLHLWAALTRPLPGALAGVILYAAGAALFWGAIAVTRGRHLAACFQNRMPETVVVTGPYRYVRHPFYVSYLLVWTGGFVGSGWWPLAITVIVMGTIYFSAASLEERTMLNSGAREEYGLYMRKTGRFLPRLSRT